MTIVTYGEKRLGNGCLLCIRAADSSAALERSKSGRRLMLDSLSLVASVEKGKVKVQNWKPDL